MQIGKLPLGEFANLGGMFIQVDEYTETKKPTYQLVAPSMLFQVSRLDEFVAIRCNKADVKLVSPFVASGIHVDGYIDKNLVTVKPNWLHKN